MAMSVPTPHTVSTARIVRTDGETYAAPTAVLTNEPCLLAPFEPGMDSPIFMGPVDTSKTVLFIGYDAEVRLGDEVTDDDSGTVYVVDAPPVKFKNPTTWESDHQQVLLRPAALQ